MLELFTSYGLTKKTFKKYLLSSNALYELRNNEHIDDKLNIQLRVKSRSAKAKASIIAIESFSTSPMISITISGFYNVPPIGSKGQF